MALANLCNCFKNLSVNTTGAIVKPFVESRSSIISKLAGSSVLLDLVRLVGKQNPFKYKRGLPSHCYRRVVYFPENEQYTTRKLRIRKLGGRDPVTGRVVVNTIGGGQKQKYRWVLFTRIAPKGQPLVEKIHSINYDPCRTAKIAMAISGNEKRWLLATVNMKAGDIITTTSDIPQIPVRPKEGDAWPLGALPVGTVVHNVEVFPNMGGFFARAAGTCCQILRKVDKRVIVQVPSKRQMSLSEECMATVGRVSNPDHHKEHIGSAQRNRWMGNRPRSGLWHRKDGYCGRKIRPLPPMKVYDEPKKKPAPIYQLSMD